MALGVAALVYGVLGGGWYLAHKNRQTEIGAETEQLDEKALF